MSKKEDGGPAFPSQVDMYGGRTEGAVRGMTLRMYIATKAMQAQIISFAMNDSFRPKDENEFVDMIVTNSFTIADAMLKSSFEE